VGNQAALSVATSAGGKARHQRGNAYYLRVVLPLHHPSRSRFPHGRVVKSLGVTSLRDAQAKALLVRAEILHGVQLRQPLSIQAAPPTVATQAPRLRDVYLRWCDARRRGGDSLRACERALRHYEAVCGDPQLDQLTAAHGDRFRAWLLTDNTSEKTARDRLMWIKALMRYAQFDLGLLKTQPWSSLDIKVRDKARRRPWTQEELQTLFNHPIWSTGTPSHLAKAGGAASYWIPLLALYTGARCSELCQLNREDVKPVDGVPCIRISDTDDHQQVKSAAGRRLVPLHSELLRLGFFDYVATLPEGRLWPELPLRKEKPGGFFSAYFSSLRDSLGISREAVLHGLRHNVRTQLADSGLSETLIDRLMGHESGGSVGARVYTHIGAERLQAGINRLEFPTAKIVKMRR
jgi:integrase